MKILCQTKDHADIQATWDEAEATKNALLERADFLNAQAKKLHEDSEAAGRALWDKNTELLKEKGLLPAEYNDATHCLSFDDGQIIMKTMDERMAEEIVKKIPKELTRLLSK